MSAVSEEPMRVGRNGWAGSWWRKRDRTEISQRARRSSSGENDLSTALRANGERAAGSVDTLWTRKTVPMAPLPRTLIARRLSKSRGIGGGVQSSICVRRDGDGDYREREMNEGERE
ncbi:unnamed protein product [Cuscuta epithymum]|uniref:Uncharacterized protein n=1 Tax=Cuscuta epithymum TaxID=186058 RepID=A0AAV0DL09_9ASTE|nr:unnamed protein product [Cuscuta epithymum]